ncbi:hypothetical protein ABVK25_012109 [Lepraria finkii]|uniref:Uncharacterized protein n=1 Tax=Lepraria finkii TaxID=1340010 RepID=A0ABR4AL68_9LECA
MAYDLRTSEAFGGIHARDGRELGCTLYEASKTKQIGKLSTRAVPFGLRQHHQYKSAELSKPLAQSSQRLTRLHQDVPNVTNISSDNPLSCIIDCPSSSPQQRICQTDRSNF